MNVMYFDAEYSQYVEETIAVGCVFYNEEEKKVLDRYYSLVKPLEIRNVSFRITEITGLTRNMFKDAPGFFEVYSFIMSKMKEYRIEAIYVWGSDKPVLVKDFKRHKEFTISEKNEFTSKVIDLSDAISHTFSKTTLSLQKAKFIYGKDDEVSHNALDDAEDLMFVHVNFRNPSFEAKKRMALYNQCEGHRLDVQRIERAVWQLLDHKADVMDLVTRSIESYQTKESIVPGVEGLIREKLNNEKK